MSTNSLPGLEAVQLLEVDPASLAVDMQVRSDATPDDTLIASVKAFDVQQPPTVYWDAERAKHVIVMGHRRVGAAIAAGLSSIHVLVRDASEAQDAARVERQLVENERREALTPADTARGYKELQLFGRTPEEIAASVGEKPERVKAALKAVVSTKAAAAMEQGIDLEQAALIAEFEGDEDTQATLSSAALHQPHDFDRRVLVARGARERAERAAVFVAELEADGTRHITSIGYEADYYRGDDGELRVLSKLGIDPVDHEDCPGHAAVVERLTEPEHAGIAYVCTNWRAHGHELVGAGLAAAVPPTPEELERQEEFARLREEREQARIEVNANTTARRNWLRGFIGGRLNQTAGIFDLVAAGTLHPGLQEGNADHIGIYILTGEEVAFDWEGGQLRRVVEQGTATALRVLVINALARIENLVGDEDVEAAPDVVEAYFDHLEGWGYQLTEIDKSVCAAASELIHPAAAADEADDVEGDE